MNRGTSDDVVPRHYTKGKSQIETTSGLRAFMALVWTLHALGRGGAKDRGGGGAAHGN